MGIVEGLTEFLPISSTGHLIILDSILKFEQSIGSRSVASTFEIFIQLGAILAVMLFFARDLIALLKRAPRDRTAQRLLLAIAIAFVPAAAIGFLFNSWIDDYEGPHFFYNLFVELVQYFEVSLEKFRIEFYTDMHSVKAILSI